MAGQPQKAPQNAEKSHHTARDTPSEKQSPYQEQAAAGTPAPVQGGESAALSKGRRTVIIGKRKVAGIVEDGPDPSASRGKTGGSDPQASVSQTENDGLSVDIRDQFFRARDEIFEGKGVRKPSLPLARDSTLLHTELKPKKRTTGQEDTKNDNTGSDQAD